MKKILSILIALIMIFTLVTPAYAATLTSWWSQIPVVSIAGDGEPLYDAQGNKIFKTTDLLSGLKGGEEDGDSDIFAVKMTEENCHTEAWEADKEADYPTDILTKVFNFLKAFFDWIKLAFEKISVKQLIVS